MSSHNKLLTNDDKTYINFGTAFYRDNIRIVQVVRRDNKLINGEERGYASFVNNTMLTAIYLTMDEALVDAIAADSLTVLTQAGYLFRQMISMKSRVDTEPLCRQFQNGEHYPSWKLAFVQAVCKQNDGSHSQADVYFAKMIGLTNENS